MNSIPIRFITDYVCPYCYAAKKIFLEAAKDYDVEIQWMIIESTKTTEPPLDVFHDMAKKRQYKKEVAPYVKKYNISMKLPPEVIPRPYTRLAALGGLYAEDNQLREPYDNAVMDAYFLEERDIGQEEVLLSIAEAVGLDREGFREAIHSEVFAGRLSEEEKKMEEELGVKTLPTIEIDDSVKLEGGIYTIEKYRGFLERARKKLDASLISIEEPVFFSGIIHEEDLEEISIVKGQGCSIDGCY